MNKKLLIAAIAILLNCSSTSSQKLNDIVGKWQGYKKELLNPKKSSSQDKPIKMELILTIKDDGTVIENQGNQSVSYYLFDSLLVLGNRKYIIENVSKDEMIMIDVDEMTPNNPFLFRYYFKRLRIDERN